MKLRNLRITALLLLALGSLTSHLTAQEVSQDRRFNPVLTSVPSLNINPSARAAGLADMGVSTTPDVQSQYFNPAKYAFLSSKAGISMSYTPWLAKLVKDIKLMELVGYYKIGRESNQALSASIRYFSFGAIEQFGPMSESLGEAHPNEFAVDFGYGLQLSDSYSMAVALRYIRADNNLATGEKSAGNAFAADIAGFYNRYFDLGSAESLWTFGFNIKNIGTKISYDNGATSMFIPTNLSLGTGLLYPFDEYNALAFNVEANKLLVPTPPVKDQARHTTLLVRSISTPPPSQVSSPRGLMHQVASRRSYRRSPCDSVLSTATTTASSYVRATTTCTLTKVTSSTSPLVLASR